MNRLNHHSQKPAEIALRLAVEARMPELKRLRRHGYTFDQLAKVLESVNIHIRPYVLRDIFYELITNFMEECVARTDEQILLLMELEAVTGEHRPSPDPSGDKGNNVPMRCDPFPPSIKPLERREGVAASVYDIEDLMEHPAIPGLMLSKSERVFRGCLTYQKRDGAMMIESSTERRFRIKWQKPIPMTPSSTSGDFRD